MLQPSACMRLKVSKDDSKDPTLTIHFLVYLVKIDIMSTALKAKQSSVVEKTIARLHVHVHPSSLLDVDLGIREHLNSLLLRYNESLDGIPIAYSEVKRLSKAGAISPYFPLCDVLIEASLTLLRPRAGMVLIGKVTEVSDTFIGILIFNLINCVIQIDDISSSDFVYSVFEQKWKSPKDSSHSISPGDAVKFIVERVDNHGCGYITVVGGLKSRGKGCTPALGNVEYIRKQRIKGSVEDGIGNKCDVDVDKKSSEKKKSKKEKEKKKRKGDDGDGEPGRRKKSKS